MVFLYGLAAFLETGIGVWIFGQIFRERERMEKRHYFSEWMVFLWITLCSWSLPKLLFVIEDKKKYIQTLILLHLTILLLYIGYKTWKKQWGQKEEVWIKALLFVGVSVFVGWQYWCAFQSYSAALFGNIFPVFFCGLFMNARLDRHICGSLLTVQPWEC